MTRSALAVGASTNGASTSRFADRAGLSWTQAASLTHGDSSDACWTEERDRLLIQAADALPETAQLPDDLWQLMAAAFSDAQALDVLLLCGWHHAISFAANGAHVALEEGTPRFDDYGSAGREPGSAARRQGI